MSRSIFTIRALAVVIVLTGSPIRSLSQSNTSAGTTRAEVVLTKLADPLYPPLARQTQITGDVELMLEIKADGSVKSANVANGHPLLKQAALDSAQRSQFECRNCGDGEESYRLIYSFRLGPTRYCTDTSDSPKGNQQQETYPRVIQSRNHVTVVDQAVGTCDLAGSVSKVRSWKCLYLWRCASL